MNQAAADKVKQIREYLRKMTPGPWVNGWLNSHGAGCTGPESAALMYIGSDSGLPMVSQPNAIKQSADDPKSWYGRGIARTYTKDDAEGIAKLRTDAEWLLSQLSASEERVRKLEKGLRDLREAVRGRDDICTCNYIGEAPCAIQAAEDLLLPSPPQVIRG